MFSSLTNSLNHVNIGLKFIQLHFCNHTMYNYLISVALMLIAPQLYGRLTCALLPFLLPDQYILISGQFINLPQILPGFSRNT